MADEEGEGLAVYEDDDSDDDEDYDPNLDEYDRQPAQHAAPQGISGVVNIVMMVSEGRVVKKTMGKCNGLLRDFAVFLASHLIDAGLGSNPIKRDDLTKEACYDWLEEYRLHPEIEGQQQRRMKSVSAVRGAVDSIISMWKLSGSPRPDWLNDMAEGVSVAKLSYQVMRWKDDCLQVKLLVVKNDRTSERVHWKNCYANVVNPERCMLLWLAVAVFSKSMQENVDDQE
jgi:hypothetical protein